MTAHEQYDNNLKKIQEQMEELQKKLKHHALEESKDQSNWGFAGDTAYIASQLLNINESFYPNFG